MPKAPTKPPDMHFISPNDVHMADFPLLAQPSNPIPLLSFREEVANYHNGLKMLKIID